MQVKIFLLIFFTIICKNLIEASDGEENESTDPRIQLSGLMEAVGWEKYKLLDLKERLNFDSAYNTLIAWKNVYDKNGDLKETQTMEAVIEPAFEKTLSDIETSNYEYTIKELRNYYNKGLNVLREIDVFHSMYNANLDEEGKTSNMVYGTQNQEIYSNNRWDDFTTTYTDWPAEDIEDFIKFIKNKTDNLIILPYDVDGNLIESQTVIPDKPNSIVRVLDGIDHATPIEIVEDIPKMYTKLLLEFVGNDLLTKLEEVVSKKYPQYDWGFMVGKGQYENINCAFSINLSFNRDEATLFVYAK